MENQTASPANQSLTEPTTAATLPVSKGNNLKKILIGLIIALLLVAGSAAAYFFVLPMLQSGTTIDCQNYNFFMNQTGEVTVTNNGTDPSEAQSATVLINDTEDSNFEVPIIQPSETSTIGIITAPTQSFTWQVIGSDYCANSGTHEIIAEPQITAQCDVIKAYDKDWKLLTSTELANLKPGDIIRFTVQGSSESGEFTKARFTINEEVRSETSSLKPETQELYDEYEVPEEVTTFVVNAQVYNQELDQWF